MRWSPVVVLLGFVTYVHGDDADGSGCPVVACGMDKVVGCAYLKQVVLFAKSSLFYSC